MVPVTEIVGHRFRASLLAIQRQDKNQCIFHMDLYPTGCTCTPCATRYLMTRLLRWQVDVMVLWAPTCEHWLQNRRCVH